MAELAAEDDPNTIETKFDEDELFNLLRKETTDEGRDAVLHKTFHSDGDFPSLRRPSVEVSLNYLSMKIKKMQQEINALKEEVEKLAKNLHPPSDLGP